MERGGLVKRKNANGCQLKILLYAFKLAQQASYENKNSFELFTQLVGLIFILTKEFLIGSHLCIGSISTSFYSFLRSLANSKFTPQVTYQLLVAQSHLKQREYTLYSFLYEPLFSCWTLLGFLYRFLWTGTRGQNRIEENPREEQRSANTVSGLCKLNYERHWPLFAPDLIPQNLNRLLQPYSFFIFPISEFFMGVEDISMLK